MANDKRIDGVVSMVAPCTIRLVDTSIWESQQQRDEFVLVTTCGLVGETPNIDLSNGAIWNWYPSVNGTYFVCMFLCPVYDPTYIFPIYSGVYFHNGAGYYYDPTIPGTPWIPNNETDTPDVSSEWKPATTIDDYYNNVINQFRLCFQNIKVDCIQPEQFDSTITKMGCLKWKLCSTQSGDYTVNIYSTLNIVDVDSLENIDPILTSPWNPEVDCLEIELPKDGVYIITITEVINGNDYVVSKQIIKDFCTLRKCMAKLALSIMCHEHDPCCQTCSKEQKEQYRIWADHLNMMNALYMEFNAELNIQLTNCLFGLTDTEQELSLQMLIDIINELNNLSDRCGECYGATSKESTSPCKNC